MATAHGALRPFTKSNLIILQYRGINAFKSDYTKQICFIQRLKSTSASVVTADTVTDGEEKFQKDKLDLTFENTKDAYKSKTTWELIRALMVLKLSTYDFLAENNQQVSVTCMDFILVCNIYVCTSI